jgi:HPt (histidine-containing phosphotransfer) domain-containing protein
MTKKKDHSPAASANSDAAVRQFDDHEVIMPPNKLKKAMVKARPKMTVDADPIAKAEAALGELAAEFEHWMEKEWHRLDTARRAVKKSGFTTHNHDQLFRAAHDIKGEAETFGYPLAGPVAESLCRLIEHTPEPARIPMALLDQHVDGIRAIVTKNARGDTERTAKRLAERLRHVTDEFLAHENRHRPDYLEGILAPPLAPGDGAVS